ncbi:MAG: Spy/CpxP family protein refolding chaperone [Burkholderiaceae bacterium]|nr:Spy/CpxP family protein refolding chaperone [Burkholderiaceae bacterium]
MATTSRSPFNAARLFGGAVLVAVLGSMALSAWAQGGPGGHDGGPGMLGMPMHGRMVERMLDRVNATTEQRAQIRQIADRAAAERKAQRESGRALREQGLQLFSQTVVDANAAEALRQQMLQQHDQGSRRMMQTILEVSRVLTPEQRQQLAERMAQRGDMMRRHMQERQSLDGAPQKR